MNKPVFYDPQRKRWKRLRRVFDLLALFGAILGIVFLIGLLRVRPLQSLDLRSATKRYRALSQPPALETRSHEKLNHSLHRESDLKPSEVALNSGEGLRAAFYTDVDPAGYASLKRHIKQLDIIMPEWLHVVTPDGNLTAYTSDNTAFNVVDSSGVHGVDRENKVVRAISAEKEDTEIYPLVNNFSPTEQDFADSVGDFVNSPAARANFLHQIDQFFTANTRYRGLTLNFQRIPAQAVSGYQQLIAALYSDFQARKLRLYINVAVGDPTADFAFLAGHADGLILLNYDQHQPGTDPGPIAGQDWFENNLRLVMKLVPREKIICSLGSYAYDWTSKLPTPAPPQKKGARSKQPPPAALPEIVSAASLSTQEAWQAASDAGAKVELDEASLNPHFGYDDVDGGVRHQVWMLDAVTVLNQMRVARALGLQTFALWRLGEEDDSLWKIWDKPLDASPVKDLADVSPGQDVDTEGDGDVLRVTGDPQNGHRTLTMDDDESIPGKFLSVVSESMDSYPLPYTVTQYGYRPKQVAISFDDGPDPTWTPKILDVLKRYNVKGTFFMIGEEAEDNVSVMQRVFREGHEIGNHTFTHPDISEISKTQVDLQLTLTERLFAAKLGVQPTYFRPPYSIDQEPDTNDQAEPIDRIEHKLGFVIVGDKIDTNDWDEHPRKSPQQMIDSVFQQIDQAQTRPWMRGSIILMHDGGGNRSATVAALPKLIEALRARGYEIVPVSQLIGKTRDEVMPPLTGQQRYAARFDSITFFFIGFFNHFVIYVFFIGDFLMSARLIIIGLCALIDRFRKRKSFADASYAPEWPC